MNKNTSQDQILIPFTYSISFLPHDYAGRTARELLWTNQILSVIFIPPWFPKPFAWSCCTWNCRSVCLSQCCLKTTKISVMSWKVQSSGMAGGAATLREWFRDGFICYSSLVITCMARSSDHAHK
jgi:hypothetical protein